MKDLKWTSVSEFVDYETGEILDKKTVDKNYLIIRKKIIRHVKDETNTVTGERYKRGIVKITNICTRNGKQLYLF